MNNNAANASLMNNQNNNITSFNASNMIIASSKSSIQ